MLSLVDEKSQGTQTFYLFSRWTKRPVVENNDKLKQSPTFTSTEKTQWSHFIMQRTFSCTNLGALAQAPHCKATVCPAPALPRQAPGLLLFSAGHCYLPGSNLPFLAACGPIRKQRSVFQKLCCNQHPQMNSILGFLMVE